MALANKHLNDPIILGTTPTTLFANPPGQVSLVAGAIFHNFSGANATFTLWNRVQPSGGSVGTTSNAYEVISMTLASNTTFVWRVAPMNLLNSQNMAMIGLCSVSNAVSVYVCGATDAATASIMSYVTLNEPVLIGAGTGASSTVVYQNPGSGKFLMSGYLLHNTSASAVVVQLWHLVPGVGGSAGTPANNQKIFSFSLPAKGSASELSFLYPHPACYEDNARSFRATASVASAVSIYVTGASYV